MKLAPEKAQSIKLPIETVEDFELALTKITRVLRDLSYFEEHTRSMAVDELRSYYRIHPFDEDWSEDVHASFSE